MSEDPKSSTKYVMVESGAQSDEDEIDLLELIRTLLKAWKTIVGIIVLCTGLAVAYALYSPEVFRRKHYWRPLRRRNRVHPQLLVSSVAWLPWLGFLFPAIPMSNRLLPH